MRFVSDTFIDRISSDANQRRATTTEHPEHQHRRPKPVFTSLQLAPFAGPMDFGNTVGHVRAFDAPGSLHRSPDRWKGQDPK
jgi:hypothetical protein